MNDQHSKDRDCTSTCQCSGKSLARRDFIKVIGAGAGATMGSALPVMAGPFENQNEYLAIIAADKKLDPAWVRSLRERGEKETYSDPSALRHIGMPVGGFFAGTVYLSGDGRLWLWDIFNRDQEGIDPRPVTYNRGEVRMRDGANYVQPASQKSPFEIGFTLQVGNKTRSLDLDGFADVTFDGRYPIGRVTYKDVDGAVEVQLDAFSPFVPLNVDDSSLPATIMSYAVRNTSQQPIDVQLAGFLENPVCWESGINRIGRRKNLVVVDEALSAVVCSAAPVADQPDRELVEQRDFGTMALALLDRSDTDRASASRDVTQSAAEVGLGDSLTGNVVRTIKLQPGEQRTVNFAVTWHFPNFRGHKTWFKGQTLGHWYASKFDSALDVARYIGKHLNRLAGDTRTWVETWYDSTLPYWLLDRTMASTSTLATTTCYRHRDGRYWCWEGIGCCPGTCTHVWHYAQAPGRLFPEAERDQRQRVDFGLAFDDQSGAIHYRAEVHNHHADDGQCGRILGLYREHRMSADNTFLQQLWPKVKKAVQFMVDRDADADGILNGAQPNTLDAAWYGKISFTSSLYLAALKAGEAMAREMGDSEFAKQCSDIAATGAQSILQLYNGEYFIQREDPAHKDKIGVGPGCYIDQVFGQTWAHWVDVGRLFDRDKQLSALRSLWKYNFVPDVGPFRDTFVRGRWYATAGDAGLLMCTWPQGGKNPAFKNHWQYMYFNECMSGFEWQVAAHMIWEGHDQADLLDNGLSVSRAIHDRYHAALRNPYNEIECSDHYARAMASYGVFQAVCGFNCHGPQGHLGFEPRLSPDDFHGAFVASTGWGSYRQQRSGKAMQAAVQLRHGRLRLRTIQLAPRSVVQVQSVQVTLGDQAVGAVFSRRERHVVVQLEHDVQLKPNQSLNIALG